MKENKNGESGLGEGLLLHVSHSLFLIPAKGSLASYCILIIMSGMLRPCWYVAEGGRAGVRFWKAGSLTSEKGSCTLTLLLEVRGDERHRHNTLNVWIQKSFIF